ncbi:hypothetical protein U14_02833 [Candidatus Moduliflexus flocculans]|uniref:Glutamate synthase n=1 Tax=Candidatus Moduliflexus flocculans TaxID=1499966 RepID=A0A081BMH2_9BACT|nr:hypothetical protein U14_02833 [Candidatus Moduliflexus flocculans]
MSMFHPMPFSDLIRRVFVEYKRCGKILGVPEEKFYTGCSGSNLSLQYMGQTASTPFGPAAGPHTQLAQNIIAGWLTGARIFELKTVQILEDIRIPRPCIDTETIGFNVEWSQELPLDLSLREYVKAWMVIEMIAQSDLFGEEFSRHHAQTVFDLSVGYDFKGIKSKRMHDYIKKLTNAHAVIEELRAEIPDEFARFKTLEYRANIVDTITLSTFHGCPPEEIDHIVSHLLTEHRVNVVVKLNPTLLGPDIVSNIVQNMLGYEEIQLDREAFKHDLRFDQAIDLIRGMYHTASSMDKALGLKLTNTLVVKNHKRYFADEVMYLSGPPLHLLALHLLEKVRSALGDIQAHIPVSFSAGVDEHNFADVASLNVAPVTVCTDMLKAPGYAKGRAYLERLCEKMLDVDAINLPDFIMKRFRHEVDAINDVFIRLRDEVHKLGQQLPENSRYTMVEEQLQIFANLHRRVVNALKENSDSLELLTTDALIVTETLKIYNQRFGESFLVPHTFRELYHHILAAAAERNLDSLLEEVTHDPHYTYAKNKQTPKKLASHLTRYDCASCGNCIAVCPNLANFAYHVAPVTLTCQTHQLDRNGYTIHALSGGEFRIKKPLQIAHVADSCNECGVCAIHCVEQGKPHADKPRYFRSQEGWESRKDDGFFVEKDGDVEHIAGRIQGKEYQLWHNTQTNMITCSDGRIEATLNYSDHAIQNMIAVTPGGEAEIFDMRIYHILLTQLKGVLNEEDCNDVNIKYL